ncbi:hypothetical protein GL218_09485 [Daldinia childiae]|uniref:uncharacterized protein n=1 Tax=Daldinia childiae TaxID=326645 RepID=UPI001446E384|nr:uncharacterized protein GL218_06619 [Daldinia childiae]XP_033435999.1 uncharacterized protein GL218_09545 [Daldinia childiae]XP_033437670.1 uncharacterized protein GL218_09485 [Daldinia childiae]KAF3056495.1 hypothetical protein GL218_06619 [Daldinia childiae]KAF3060338.1 hypothetical protein GL218_09545 [Daldinia childiae]KAF3062795.1 hypothetical protein GL218_09485 [Daldinia childiae]
MTVTELAWFTAAHGPAGDDAKKAMNQALVVLDDWCARNTSTLPKDREARGVGLFRQIEDPSVTLLTAHWESVSQHGLWLASTENKTVYPALKEHFTLEKTVVSHLENAEFFDASGPNGDISLLKSPIVSLSAVTVPAEKRKAFEQAWTENKHLLEGYTPLIKSGWRIEKEDENLEQFILSCSWPSVEKHIEFAGGKDFPQFSAALLSLAQGTDLKHYERIL